MAENDEDNNVGRFNVSSKFWGVFLLIAAVFLIFAGPTYISYLLFNILDVNYVVSTVSGFVLFIAGLFLMWFLIRKKIIT